VLVLVLAEKSVMLLLLFLVAVAVSPAEILPALVPARQHNPVVEKADANYRLFSSSLAILFILVSIAIKRITYFPRRDSHASFLRLTRR